MKNSRFVQRLKLQAEENPMLTIFIGVSAATVLTKMLQASTERSNARTWKREVDRRRSM